MATFGNGRLTSTNTSTNSGESSRENSGMNRASPEAQSNLPTNAPSNDASTSQSMAGAVNRFQHTTEGANTQETTEFVNETTGQVIEANSLEDDSFAYGALPDASLNDFFSRPVLIQTFTWNAPSFSKQTFNPWFDYFNDVRVKKKLDNYAFINCNLHVKFVINASPFYYGMIKAIYKPLQNFAPNQSSGQDALDKVMYSQRSHISILPASNSGGDMILPFFYPKDWLHVGTASDFTGMGEITMYEYDTLNSANGGTVNGTTIQVFAWAENVRLTGPTVALSMQNDEYGQGIISYPASAVAAAAGYFENIPVIGKFATATQIGATAVSKIASLFGWSNPPVIEDVKPYKPMLFHSMGTAEICEPVDKLTLDPKNELTVDTRVAGLDGKDELAISSIVQRESFLFSTGWSTTDVHDDILCTAAVTPSLWTNAVTGVTDGYRRAFTPMSHIAQMFQNWRGDVIFRFKVICTQYHKGRLAIIWDPVGDLVNNADYTNVAYTKVIDIGQETDVEFRVPYLQALAWLQTSSLSSMHATDQNWDSSSPYTVFSNTDQFNGSLIVRVLTNLSAPVDVSTVNLFVYVRGAENMEFANPVDISQRFSKFDTQNSEVPLQTQALTVQNPLGLDICNTTQPPKNRYLINFGECVDSIRTLLRRSSAVDTLHLNFFSQTGGDWQRLGFVFRPIPSPAGYDPDGIHTADNLSGVGTSPYNFTYVHPINWMSYCFIGRRGSVRWHLNANSPLLNSGSVCVTRTPRLTDKTLTSFNDSEATATNSLVAHDWIKREGGTSGTVVTNQHTMSAISFEMPMYNNRRFVSTHWGDVNTGNSIDNTENETYLVQLQTAPNARTFEFTQLDRYCCIGTDFNFIYYLNAPIMYVYDSVPDAA